MIALAILDRKSAQALDRRVKAADQARAASRKYMDSAAVPAAPMTNDNQLTEPLIIGPVTVVPAGYRRVRAVVVRTCREQAIVEFDMPETANTYDLSEELLAAIPPTAWQECTSDHGYAYIDRITDIAGTKSIRSGLQTKSGITADELTAELDDIEATLDNAKERVRALEVAEYEGADEEGKAPIWAALSRLHNLSLRLSSMASTKSAPRFLVRKSGSDIMMAISAIELKLSAIQEKGFPTDAEFATAIDALIEEATELSTQFDLADDPLAEEAYDQLQDELLMLRSDLE